MADEDLPAAHEKGNSAANNNPGQDAGHNDINKVKPGHGNTFVSIVEIAGGIIFATIAVACDASGFHTWGFFFGFIAVVCGLAVGQHHLRKAGVKHINKLFALSVIAAFILFGFLAYHAHLHESAMANIPASLPPQLTEEPSKIIEEFGRARPAQAEAVASGFIGAKVRWLLRLEYVKTIRDTNTIEKIVEFEDGAQFPKRVVITISESDGEVLRLSEKGALFYVSGTIANIDGLNVWLSDAKLETYPSKNSP